MSKLNYTKFYCSRSKLDHTFDFDAKEIEIILKKDANKEDSC